MKPTNRIRKASHPQPKGEEKTKSTSRKAPWSKSKARERPKEPVQRTLESTSDYMAFLLDLSLRLRGEENLSNDELRKRLASILLARETEIRALGTNTMGALAAYVHSLTR